MKTCTRCDTEKPLNEFYRRSDSSDGRRSECKACSTVYYVKGNKIKTNHYSHLNVTREEFIKLRNQRDNANCEICGGNENMAIDHDHETGEVRGFLCYACNTGLGFFQDNEQLLLNAMDYLANAKERQLNEQE